MAFTIRFCSSWVSSVGLTETAGKGSWVTTALLSSSTTWRFLSNRIKHLFGVRRRRRRILRFSSPGVLEKIGHELRHAFGVFDNFPEEHIKIGVKLPPVTHLQDTPSRTGRARFQNVFYPLYLRYPAGSA